MKYFSVFMLLLSVLLSKAQNNIDFAKNIVLNGCGGNMQQVDLFSADLNKLLSTQEKAKLKADLEKEFIKYSTEASNKVLSKYEIAKRDANITKGIIEANKVKWELIGEVVGDVAKLDPDMGSRTVLKVSAFVGKKALDYSTDYLKGQVDEARRKRLDGLLYNMRQANKNYINDLSNHPDMDDDTFVNILFNSNEENKKFYESLESSDRIEYVKHMHEELKEAVKRSELKGLGRDKELAKKIYENEKLVRDIENGIKKDLASTKQNIESLTNAQTKIQENFNALTARVDLNTRDLDFIKDYLYGKMSAAEKLRAIDHGFLNNLNDSERKKEKEKIELLKAQEEFVSSAKEYLDDTKNILSIARNLGLKSPLLDKAEQGLRIANAGMEAFSAFSSQNYLGAVASVTSLFARKSDPTMGKLQAIEKKLNIILHNQQIIKQQLSQIQLGINQLLDGQQKLYTTITKMAAKIDDQFNTVHKKLDAIHIDVLTNRRQVHAYSSREQLLTIHSYLLPDRPARRRLNVLKDSLPEYDTAMHHIIIPNYTSIKDFHQRLRDIFNVTTYQDKRTLEQNRELFHLPQGFKMTEFLNNADPLIDINNGTIVNLMKMDSLFKEFLHEHNTKDVRAYYASLLIPFVKCSDLNKKDSIEISPAHINGNEQLEEILNFLDCDISSQLKTERDNNYLEPRYLMEATEVLINFHYLYSFLNHKLDTVSKIDAINGNAVIKYQIDILKKARFLINIAITQQILLSGDILIPYMYKKLNRGLVFPPDSIKTPEAQIQKLCLRILESNDLARVNFTKYYITQRLKEFSNIFNYSLGLMHTDPRYLKQTLQVADSIDWKNSSSRVHQLKLTLKKDPRDSTKTIWSYSLPTQKGELFFPMPSSTEHQEKLTLDELIANRMQYRNAIDQLVVYKKYLDRQITMNELMNSLPKSDMTSLNKVILYSNLSD